MTLNIMQHRKMQIGEPSSKAYHAENIQWSKQERQEKLSTIKSWEKFLTDKKHDTEGRFSREDSIEETVRCRV